MHSKSKEQLELISSPKSKAEDFADEVAQSTKARSIVQSSMTFGLEADLSGTDKRMLPFT